MAKVSLRAYNREIEAMIDRNHLDEAIAHCKHILKSFPKHLETYRLLGKAYLEYKRYPDAVDIFSRVLVAVPNDFVSHVGMSIIRDEENKLDDAIWHMERAFETQPSNAAIQSELQRLYGRRDGVQLPRIRMTHGALAHMYVKGELYPQAISEIKSVLKEDPGRNDMQMLLARAYYRSGAKNDAAEAASALLRMEPYCLDANRILVEILSTDHPENVQAYRQRVIELDPYAAQVSGSIFLSDEVPDVAVSIERLDWNGQPVGLQPDWETKQAISLDAGQRSQEEPDWLRNAFSETPPLVGQTPVTPFDAAPPSAEPATDLPDFLQAAGWGQATGAFDESKSAFADAERESASNEAAIAPGDLPDWVKAMAPEQSTESPAQEEELPDWINRIDKSALPTTAESTDQPDWMSQLEQPTVQPAEDQPDWLKQLDSTEGSADSSGEQPDWLKGFEKESASSVPSTGELDWLSTLSKESKPAETPSNEFDFLNQPAGTSEAPASTGELDWLSQVGDASKPLETSSNEFDFLNQPVEETQPTKTIHPSEEFDFLKELDTKPEATPAEVTDDFDFLNELVNEPEQLAPTSTPEPSMQDTLGMSRDEQDDSFAWLESLASKQGATEGLLTKPEERLEEEPDWVKQAKGMDVHADQPPAQQTPVTQPAGHLDELGKTEQERDDSFAWLESLAAKQGATEGLLTKPEERLEEEPEWVRQAKSVSDQPEIVPAAQAHQEQAEDIPSAKPEPTASLEELGKSEAERDDAFAWLESLAAKQGATEGLLTKPEERLEEEPEWVRQAKSVSDQPEIVPAAQAHQEQAEEIPSAKPEPTASLEELGKSEAERDDAFAWLESLAAKQGATEGLLTKPEERLEEEPEWVRQAKDVSAEQISAQELSPIEDTAAWLRSLDEEDALASPEPVSSTLAPGASAGEDDTAMWFKNLDEPQKEIPPQPAQEPQPVDLPEWMQGIEEDRASETKFNIPVGDVGAGAPEGEAAQPSQSEDLPEWMQGIEEDKASETVFNIPVDEVPAGIAEEAQSAQLEDLPEWMQGIEEDKASETDLNIPVVDMTTDTGEKEPVVDTEWMGAIEQEAVMESAAAEPEPAKTPAEELPSWLSELEEEQEQVVTPTGMDADLPAWLRDATGEVLAEPTRIEPTRSTDWHPVESREPAPEVQPSEPEPEPMTARAEVQAPQPEPAPVMAQSEAADFVSIIEEKIAAVQEPVAPPPPPRERKLKGTGKLSMPLDPILGQARSELSGSNLSGALDHYARLIKKGRFLDEVIFDLRDALYRFPVDVNIWQSLGDAYMRANRLQDALDAYTKAEELLR